MAYQRSPNISLGKLALGESESADARTENRGKASQEKGKRFEDEVADLYRLLGAEVIQGIEVCHKKVDILVLLPVQGSHKKHRIIVECKDEKRAVDAVQRVMQFKGLLSLARETGEADSAEIITRVPWSEQAKGFALKSGIELLTYSEKISRLINFGPYLKNLVNRFAKGDPLRPNDPPLGAYYVELSVRRKDREAIEQIPGIDDYVSKWLRHDGNMNHLAIFGEYGSGKTSFCQKLAHDLGALYLNGTVSARIPLLFNLRDFVGAIRMEAFIAAFLDHECGVPNPKYELFRVMNEASLFLLIFDGLDEMAAKVDADTLELNLMEIEKLTGHKTSKAILTSRPEYFISEAEERQVINPKANIFSYRTAEYEPLQILPWSEAQITLFCKQRVPLISEAKYSWTRYAKYIKNIPGLSDLSRRPVLLEMIVKTLPVLVKRNAAINLPGVYEIYLDQELRRQKIVKKRRLLLTEEARLSLLKNIAIDLYINKSQMTFSYAANILEQLKIPREELDAYTRDFLANSFLTRDGDAYHFSHKSIGEYLVATQLIQEIENDDPSHFCRVPLDEPLIDFIKDSRPNVSTLRQWLKKTPSLYEEGSKTCLGGNAATLLGILSPGSFTKKDYSQVIILNAPLRRIDFSASKLRNAVLRGSDLRESVFTDSDLSYAKLNQCNLQESRLCKTNLRGADLRDANLQGANLEEAEMAEVVSSNTNYTSSNLTKSNLKDATLNKANFSHAKLDNALLDGASLSGADLSGATLVAAKCRESKLNRVILDKTDLSRADLSGASLQGNNLRQAILSGAILTGVNFNGSDLCNTDLTEYHFGKSMFMRSLLRKTNLRGVDLRGANFSDADLSDADLSGADLSGARLWNTKLERANLQGANLSNADLTGATLLGTNLADAILLNVRFCKAILRDAKNVKWNQGSTITIDKETLLPPELEQRRNELKMERTKRK